MQPIPLEGRHIRLEPFDDTLREPVRAALDCDPDAWRLFAINGQGADFDAFWRSLNAQVAQGGWIAYAVRHAATGAVVGTTSFLNIKPTRQTVEIGGTHVRDSVLFAVTDLDWPDVRARLARRLG